MKYLDTVVVLQNTILFVTYTSKYDFEHGIMAKPASFALTFTQGNILYKGYPV